MDTATMVPAEFETLYREHCDAVYRSAFRILGSAEDSEDILQTVFLRFLRRDPGQQHIDQPEYYLRRSAVNAALDLIRSRQAKSSPKLSLDDLHADPSQNPQQELRIRLRAALATLEPRWAEVFTLRYIEGFGNKEIAALLDMSQALVAVILFRSRQKLQKEL
jgi:RNA polymerase sigma-70 factor (ECF subfamily)